MSATSLATATCPLVLALDVGSSSVRALLFDASGHQVDGSETQIGYDARISPDGGTEVDADTLVSLAAKCIDGVLRASGDRANDIGAVACSSFWHGLLCLDGSGEPLTPVLMWSDKRSGRDAQQLGRELEGIDVHHETGCRLHSSYWPAKIAWLRRTQPDLVASQPTFASMTDYLGSRLTGTLVTSVSMASGSGLLNAGTLDWHWSLIQQLGLERPSFVHLIDRQTPLPPLLPEWTSRWPMLANVPWFPALGDGACANVGAGCVGWDRMAITIGTSAALRVILTDTGPDGAPGLPLSNRIWKYRLDRQHHVIGGALSNGGNITAWIARLAADGEFDGISTAAADIPPDGHGLTFLPFLAGERSPGWNDSATGTLTGLTLSSTSADLYRAALEAAAYRLAAIHENVVPHVSPDYEIHVNGTAALSSPLWLQVMADTLNHRLDAVDAEAEASARGAALCALQAIGQLGGLVVPDNETLIARSFTPDTATHAIYAEARNRQSRLEHAITAFADDAST